MKKRIRLFYFIIILCFYSTYLLALNTPVSCQQNKSPVIVIQKENASNVKKYEKFEICIELKNVEYQNPFNPDEIDLYAIFKTPAGESIRINGFYDNFKNADVWKIRFSPNKTGRYNYRIFVENNNQKSATEDRYFQAVDSKHHGWIRPSTVNPHYFQHDDGTSYFALGVYSPWRNNSERFETFKKYNANLFAIWDITYGGFLNGHGLIENDLGKYNQEKCGRIDSLLTILENNDIKLMYAIWPHDLFSKTVWAAQWENNPYSQISEVEDVYSDSLVWEYQKQKYRYMIARFAHSRSWGIWELINEMNGTDGWAKGRHQECYEWITKCENYFNKNDPYHHPTTASFSGGFKEYREELYKRIDIPNIHVYPKQGWKLKYPDDSLRSAMHNYAWASKRFWDAFEKPAIFGEAGADLAYFDVKQIEYHTTYHNVLWATLCSGLAGIPVWWQYPHLNEQDWKAISVIEEFTRDIDFANQPFSPAGISAKNADVFAMDSGKEGFGWLRATDSRASGKTFTIEKTKNSSFKVTWIDTRTGKTIKTERVKSTSGQLQLTVPETNTDYADMAFKFSKI